MTWLYEHASKGGLWKKLWLATALVAFGGVSWVSSVSAQDEEYLPPTVKIDEPENVERVLLQVTEYLKKESEKPQVGDQVIEFVRVITRPKEPADGQSSVGYSFSATASSGPEFEVCKNEPDPCFDVPHPNAPGTKLKKVPNNKVVVIDYDFSPRLVVQCIGNVCRPINP